MQRSNSLRQDRFALQTAIEFACDALVHQRLTVSQAAYRVGYESPANFATAFRRHFGIAPAGIASKAAYFRLLQADRRERDCGDDCHRRKQISARSQKPPRPALPSSVLAIMRGFLWGVCRVNAGPDGASPPSFDARCEPRCSAGVAVDAAGAGASRRDGTIRRDIAASQCCSASQHRTDAAGRAPPPPRRCRRSACRHRNRPAGRRSRSARARWRPAACRSRCRRKRRRRRQQHAARRGDRHRSGARLCGEAQRDGDQDRHADPGDAAVDLRRARTIRSPPGARRTLPQALRYTPGVIDRALRRRLVLRRDIKVRGFHGAALSRRPAPAARQHHHVRAAADRALRPGAASRC